MHDSFLFFKKTGSTRTTVYTFPHTYDIFLLILSHDGSQGVSHARRFRGFALVRRFNLKPEQYFKVGDVVRRINTAWSGKVTIRSNALKQGPRWSISKYRIYSRRTYADAPPTYELVLIDDGQGGNPPRPPSDFKTRTDYQGIKVSVNRFRHSDLQRVIGDEPAPQNLMDNQPPPDERWRRGDRIRVAWVRVRLQGQQQDDWTVVYGNLEARDDIAEIKWDTTRWFDGIVRRFNPGQQGRPGSINVDFPADGTTNVSVSFYDRSIHYVEPAFYERI